MRPHVLIALALLTGPAAAGASTWQQVTPDARIRLISSDQRGSDGAALIGLEIDMPARTTTYWRVPGETGIPITLDFSASTGLAGHAVAWPYPERDENAGYLDYVYRGPLVLPIRAIIDGDRAMLRADLMMGICDEICVPVSAALSLDLDLSRPDPGQSLRLAQALAEAPIAWDQPTPAIAAVHFDTALNGLSVTGLVADIDPNSLIADMGPSGPVFGAPQKSPDGRSVLLPLLGAVPDDMSLDGKPVQLTFRTPMGPYEMSAHVAPPVSTPGNS